MKKQHLVLAGAGHAHMVTMAGICDIKSLGHEVTVIGPSDYHYYSGMGPGMLGTGYEPDDIRFAVRLTIEEQGGTFIQDSVTGVDPVNRELHLESGGIVQYDVLSFNTGSHVNVPQISGNFKQIYTVKPIERLYQARTEIEALSQKQSVTVAVVGGGPAGAEAAGNVAQLLGRARHSSKVFLFAGHGLLAKFPEAVRTRSRRILADSGVIVREEGHLLSINNNCLQFDSGTVQKADFTILATGVHPSPFFREAGLRTGPDGGLLVNRYLQCPEYPEIFGGGDCIWFEEQPLDKVGVYAVRENPVLFHNLKAFLQGEALQNFDPGGEYLLIFNLGNGQGVLRKKWFQISGRIAFWIKDWIDKRFMAKFQ
jgi:NADH dehydrogenase FAD-containing subunit